MENFKGMYGMKLITSSKYRYQLRAVNSAADLANMLLNLAFMVGFEVMVAVLIPKLT